MDLIKSFSYDDTHFELKLNQLDRMVYVWYQTRLTKPVKESTNLSTVLNSMRMLFLILTSQPFA